MVNEPEGRHWKEWLFLAVSTLATYWLIREQRNLTGSDADMSLSWQCVKGLRKIRGRIDTWESRLMERIDRELDEAL